MPKILSMQKRRLLAEWEPQSAVQLTFPHADTDWADSLDRVLPVFVDIASAIARFQTVLVVCRNAAETRALLQGIPEHRLVLAEIDSNDTWARDHGGISILENDQLYILDFLFTGWGLKFPANKDNLITDQLAKKGLLSGKYRHGGMALEGGGIDSNGQGVLLTTTDCLLSPNRNPQWSRRQIENRLKNTFGLDKIIWLENGHLAGDDTDSHIDTLARFCNAQTIAYVRCDDPKDAHYADFLAMEAELRAATNQYGEAFQLIPLPWPEACFAGDGHRLPATYANFLIINGAVLVPTYGVPQDKAALEILQSAFPDRTVIGINCRELIEQHGSLHCLTMQYYQ